MPLFTHPFAGKRIRDIMLLIPTSIQHLIPQYHRASSTSAAKAIFMKAFLGRHYHLLRPKKKNPRCIITGMIRADLNILYLLEPLASERNLNYFPLAKPPQPRTLLSTPTFEVTSVAHASSSEIKEALVSHDSLPTVRLPQCFDLCPIDASWLQHA
jgi:hypothetical protein